MDSRKLTLYLSRILSGYYIFIFNGLKYKLEYPTIDIKYEADIIAEAEYEDIKYSGWPTKESIVHDLIALGVWSPAQDTNLNQLEKQIEQYKVDLYKNFINPKKIKAIRKSLENCRQKYSQLYYKRHCFDHITIEGYCDQIKNDFLLKNSIYQNDRLCFLDSDDYVLFKQVCDHIGSNTIDISDFKKIARSDQWRNYWSANKDNLFNNAVINWTDEQKTLVILTKMYENARENPDCPPDVVFEDDDMFEGWMIHQRKENEKAREKNRFEKTLPGKLNKAGEVFLSASSREEADHIYGMNDDSTRYVIKERESYIQKNKNREIKSSELPDVQRDLMAQSNEMRKNKG